MKISFSQMTLHSQCPRKWAMSKRDPKDGHINPAMSLGSCLHQAICLIRQKGQKGNLSEQERADVFEAYGESMGYQEQVEGYDVLARFMDSKWRTIPDPDAGWRILASERPFQLDFGDGCVLTGVIDAIDEAPNGVLRIVDFKSNRAIPRAADENLLQLHVYALAAYELGWAMDEQAIEVGYHWLRYDVYRPHRVEQKDLVATADFVRARHLDMVSTFDAEGKEDTKPGWHCGECPYSEGCPAMAASRGRKIVCSPDNLGKLLDERAKLEGQMSVLKERLAEIEGVCVEALEGKDCDFLQAGSWSVEAKTSVAESYKPEVLRLAAYEAGVEIEDLQAEVGSVDKARFTKWMKRQKDEQPDAYRSLESRIKSLVTQRVTRTIKVKEIEGGQKPEKRRRGRPAKANPAREGAEDSGAGQGAGEI